MKILKRMLLIHWHYFVHEMIEFEGINFLTGKNASGKSTIIDAMQLVLLADTSGSFFNKAANGRGSRTLQGYLRGELGDEDGSGFRYIRNTQFTSYIALEFYDDKKNTYFTSGCCFDFHGENDIPKLLFRFDGAIPPNDFFGDVNIPWDIDKLRAFMRDKYSAHQIYTTTINKDFREDLCGRLGGLQPKRFTELLKKAVSFNPNVKIQEFITDFVCGDEQRVVVEDMQENIRSYETLRKEADMLEDRMKRLEEISTAHSEFAKHKASEKLYDYLVNRSRRDIAEERLRSEQLRMGDLQVALRRMQGEQQHLIEKERQLQAERDELRLQLDGNESARRLEEIRRQIEDNKRQQRSISETYELCAARLSSAAISWQRCVKCLESKIYSITAASFGPALLERVRALSEEGQQLVVSAETLKTIDPKGLLQRGADRLHAIVDDVDAYYGQCNMLRDRMNDVRNESLSRRDKLLREKETLEQGRRVFPQYAVDLKAAIDSRLRMRFGANAKSEILAEIIEIADDRWRNVIEGYLNTQRFYLIVAPEHFRDAFDVYDRIRKQHEVFSAGLVDTERLKSLNPIADPKSLAEEIATDDNGARLFINYTLGRVRKSNSKEELRRGRTAAVTDDGLLYRGFVVRKMDPTLWKMPVIGRTGARLQLQRIVDELERLMEALTEQSAIITALNSAREIVRLGSTDVNQIIESASDCLRLPAIQESIDRLNADAAMIDMNEIIAIEERLRERERDMARTRKLSDELLKRIGSSQNNLDNCKNVTIPSINIEVSQLQELLNDSYDAEWVRQTGDPRYMRELSGRGNVDAIEKAFPRELARARTAQAEAWKLTTEIRKSYNDSYKMGYDVDALDNDVYDQLWLEYSDIKLPEYAGKIDDAREKALQQFQEDFLSRLQSNIFNAQRQIDELNSTMRGCMFGEDMYRFKVSAKPDYKRYYDMIVDKMLLTGGYNLLSEEFNMKYQQEIKELFEIITNDADRARAYGYDDYERRVQVYTDYKTYLDFDLEVIKPNGESERLSRTMGKKSGGETQTPFYIAVLASFVQLYRIGRDKDPNTAQIILFDEAFSKMDGERIIQSIELLRKFNFQVILSAPPDKIADIGLLVDRNLLVLREGRKTRVCVMDKRRVEALLDAE